MGAVGTAGAVLIGVGAGSAGGGITGKSYGELFPGASQGTAGPTNL